MCFLLRSGLPLRQFVNVLANRIGSESLTKRNVKAAKKEANSLVYNASFTTARCTSKKMVEQISTGSKGLLEVLYWA